MSAWLAIGLTVGGLIMVALVMLAFDVARGDVGGGHHTMERARRLLVVATDETTATGADRWITDQHKERPQLQFFVLTGPDDQDLYMQIQGAIERDRPDAIVVARHGEESHATQEGIFGRLKEDAELPVDAIYVDKETVA